MQWKHVSVRGSTNIVPFLPGLEFDLLCLCMQLTVVVWLPVRFPFRNPEQGRGGGGSIDFYLTAE